MANDQREFHGAHLRGARIILRSKTPDLVRQEFHGLMMPHFAVRSLIHDAALRADEAPDRLSLLHAVRVIRHKPQESPHLYFMDSLEFQINSVMAGLVPAIHAVDHRDKPGDDE